MKLSEIVQINPIRELRKGTVSKKVSMDSLVPFTKKIRHFESVRFASGSKFRNGDTLLARITPCLENGKTAFVDILQNGEVGHGSTEFIVLCGKEGKTTNEFVYYIATSPRLRGEAIKSMTGTSGRQRVQIDSFEKIEVACPTLNEQDRITRTLSALDSRIDLNQEMNKILEGTVKAIFKHWLIDFEFPSLDGEPYISSGGLMVDSELGNIPIGWRVGNLGEIAQNLRRGISPFNKIDEVPYIGLEHMPRRTIALSEWGFANEVVSNKFRFLKGEILFGKLRPYFHKVGVAPTDGICSTDILVISPKSPEWYSLLLVIVSSDEFVKYTDAVSTGTKMPRTNWEDMARYKIVIPPSGVAQSFNEKVGPLIQKIVSNILQSKILAEMRDTLLPNLITGKIRVPIEAG